jgi:hypothetical protein
MKNQKSTLREFISQSILREEDGRLQKDAEGNQVADGSAIDSTAFVTNSIIGAGPSDSSVILDSSIVDSSRVYSNSHVFSSSKVIDSSVRNSTIEKTEISKSALDNCKTKHATVLDVKDMANVEITNSSVRKAAVVDSVSISGGSTINSCGYIIGGKLIGTTLSRVNSQNSTITGAIIKSTIKDPYDRVSSLDLDSNSFVTLTHSVFNSQISRVSIEDCEISGADIRCDSHEQAIFKMAIIKGNVKIIGSPLIGGLTHPTKGHKQYAQVLDNAKISDKAEISGRVSGNAEVSGNAKVHGLAHVTGDCRVFGTAEMISGTFTTGIYTEGKHEGGDPPGLIQKIKGAMGIPSEG